MKSDFLKSFYNQLRQKFAKYKARAEVVDNKKKNNQTPISEEKIEICC